MWWDAPVDIPTDAAELHDMLKLDHAIIANDRLGGGYEGDFITHEQFIPPAGFDQKGRDWETCMTMNDSWGYKSFDNNYKTAHVLIRALIDITSKGGNFLLNISPSDLGTIPDRQAETLQAIGSWLKTNGESIHGAGAGAYRRLPFGGRATTKDSTLYLHVFQWPAGDLKLIGLKTPIVSAKVLATGQRLTVSNKDDEGTRLIARPDQFDPIATVLELRLSGPVELSEAAFAVDPDENGCFDLKAIDAVLEGPTIRIEGSPGFENIGYWLSLNDRVSWIVRTHGTGPTPYRVEIAYSCRQGYEGSRFAIEVDDEETEIDGIVAITDDWDDYRGIMLDGVLTLTPGVHVVRIIALSKCKFAVMNIRNLRLINDED
jgi:alpha-L-fucosidase